MTPSMDDLNITVNGTTLTQLGAWSSDRVSWRYPRGSWDLDFTVAKPAYWRHPDLVRGARVTAWLGPTPIWAGRLIEPDYDTQTYTAMGLSREGEDALCLGFGGTLTTTPSTAVSWAILRGALTWNGTNTLPSTSFAATEETVTYNNVADLLDAWSTSALVNWLVDPYGYVSYAAAPTSPTLFVTPGAGVLGVADEDYVTDLYGRYRSAPGVISSVDRHPTVVQNVGRVERGIDLTGRGTMTADQAAAVLDGILAQTGPRTGWTNPLQLSFGDISTIGATQVTLAEAARLCGLGQMIQLLGLYDERGASATTNIVIAESIWNPADESLTLNPVGLAARDLSAIVESMGGVLL